MNLPACPLPFNEYPRVVMAHGGGGRLMQQLLDRLVVPALCQHPPTHDAAVLPVQNRRSVVTTDSFVVRPLEFPGGDIGRLAACGTLNDLAMAGAKPTQLAVSLIIEEGLETETLWRLLGSLRQVADAAGVPVVTGDTKVVDRGHGDGLYITTTGIGWVADGVSIHPDQIRPGDAILVSGDLGRHGLAVLAARENLGFEPPIASDCASLVPLVADLLDAEIQPHCLRDPTRGGVAPAIAEIITAAGLGVEIEEGALPVDAAVATGCELLGLDPLFLPCEGRLLAVVAESDRQAALATLRSHPLGQNAVCIGKVTEPGPLLLRNRFGVERPLVLPAGELLPRIC